MTKRTQAATADAIDRMLWQAMHKMLDLSGNDRRRHWYTFSQQVGQVRLAMADAGK